MKNETESLDVGADLPLGFCNQCVVRMANGASYELLVARPGSSLLHAYCEHNQAGGTMVLRDGWPRRWNILQPVDVIDFHSFVALEAEELKRLDPPGAAAPAPVQTSGRAREVLQ